jgi:Helicase conserved C-terminal domain
MSAPAAKRTLKLGGRTAAKQREATEVERGQVMKPAEEQMDLLLSPPPAPPAAAAGGAGAPGPLEVASTLQPMFARRKKEAEATEDAAAPAPAPPSAPLKPAKAKPVALAPDAAAGGAGAAGGEAEALEEVFDLALTGELQPLGQEIAAVEHADPYKPIPVFPVPTRRGFQQKILQNYESFIKFDDGKPIDFEACRKMGAAGEQNVQMYLYQQFVREYMRSASPYRGLLVYHGLGSGKTCSAIATAEALFSTSRKRVIVMTPFSLRENFIKEITFCGFRHLRLQNFWVSVSTTDPTAALFATQILNLPEQYLKRNKKIWIPDFSQPPNFDSLGPDDREQIRRQVYTQIQSRIEFINYNGISSTKLKAMACQVGEKGYFDDAVIVIDEVHNVTRLMQGTIEPYLVNLPGVKRRISPEPVVPGRWRPSLCASSKNYKRGYLLYRMLSSARNSKIIGLSGTPLINFPEELGILMNLLHGYIDHATLVVRPSNDTVRKVIEPILESHPFVDFYEITLSTNGIQVYFTLLPEGTQKIMNAKGKMEGVQRLPDSQASPTIQNVAEELKATLEGKSLKVVETTFGSEPLLPPVGMQFREAFIQEDGSSLKNPLVLRKRIQGMISYYRGSKQELMPKVVGDTLVRVPMSKYAQNEYMRVRMEEIKKDIEKKGKKAAPTAVAGFVGRMGQLWAEIYDIAAMKNSNSYRMSSRQACNFVFPEKITRPRAHNQKEATEETGTDIQVLIDADGALGGQPAGEEQLAELMVTGDADEAAAAAEDEAIDREEQEEEGGAAGGGAAGGAEGDESPAIPQVEAEGAVAPAAAAAAAPKGPKTMKQLMAERAAAEESCKKGMVAGEKYSLALKRAKDCLWNFARKKLMLAPLGAEAAGGAGAAAPEGDTLDKYSPKYAAILRNINASAGSSLVYSQFLDMEGIGIFSMALEANGFVPIEIRAEAGGFVFSERTKVSLARAAAGEKQNRYLVFSGAEKREIRVLGLKLFNAKFSELPATLTSFTYTKGDKTQSAEMSLETLFPDGNKHGELCRVFCITSAGAEGLSLKNVRQVHIMEPYWNNVRTDQVKGRAVRICSHVDLEYNEDPMLNERTVEIFTYCSVFSTEAQTAPLSARVIDQTLVSSDSISEKEAREAGIPFPGGDQYVLTSDEHLYYISERKRKLLSSIQDLMKASAVDCQLNTYENKDEGIRCALLPPGTQGDFAFHPNLQKDIDFTKQVFREGGAAAAGPAAPAPPTADLLAAGPEGAAGGGGAGAPQPAAAAAQAVARTVPKFQAEVIKIGSMRYLAIPERERGAPAGAMPLIYNLYNELDKAHLKKLGTILANPLTGRPTGKVTLF